MICPIMQAILAPESISIIQIIFIKFNNNLMHFPAFEQFQKENTLLKEKYQIKTKPYSKATPEKEPFHYSNSRIDKLYSHGLGQESKKSTYNHKYQPLGSRNQTPERTSPLYNKNSPLKYGNHKTYEYERKQQQLPYNHYEKLQKTPKNTKYTMMTENIQAHEYSPFQDASMKGNKHQHGRTKQFQMKMNNIEVMNDKICSLLNIVKSDRKAMFSQINKEDHKYSPSNKYGEYSPKITELKDHRNEDKYRKQDTHKLNNMLRYQNNEYKTKTFEKSQRLRTYTGYEKSQNEDSLQIKYSKHSRQAKYNEEDTILRFNNGRTKNDLSSKKTSYREKTLTPGKYHDKLINQHLQRHHFANQISPAALQGENMSQINSIHGQSLTKDEYEHINEYQYVPKYKGPLKREEANEDSFMPVSIRNAKGYSQTKHESSIVDDKLKKIKERIKDSQKQQKNIQRKLDYNYSHQQKQGKTGQLYRTGSASAEKQFKIRIHPVPVDRQHVVEMVQRILSQVHFDNKVKQALFGAEQSELNWEQIQQEAISQNFSICGAQLQDLLREEHHYHVNKESNTQQLMRCLSEAQKHWDKEVLGCTSSQALRKDGFDPKEIDSSQKGAISESDLCHFVIRFTGKSLHSDNLSLIFKRLKKIESRNPKAGIQYSTFLRAMTV